jgi:hypothetical protein
MKIYRAKDTTIYLCDLSQWILNHTETYGKRIGISWKIGKRRKLRSYSINWNTWECDCCGAITSIELTKNGKTFKMDNHFGPGSMEMSELETPKVKESI